MFRRNRIPFSPPEDPHDSTPRRRRRVRPPRHRSRLMLLFALIGMIAVLFLLIKYAIIPILVLIA